MKRATDGMKRIILFILGGLIVFSIFIKVCGKNLITPNAEGKAKIKLEKKDDVTVDPTSYSE